jgi:deazaflavin-dependent oxidoreductase (nitroreductase family)
VYAASAVRRGSQPEPVVATLGRAWACLPERFAPADVADAAQAEETEEALQGGAMSEKPFPKPDFLTEEQWQQLLQGRISPDHTRATARAHLELYQATQGGEGSDETQGGRTLLLTTIGRKSGRDVTTPLNYVEQGESVIVVGSLFGFDEHPHWVRNLDKHPRGWVQIKDRKWPVTAHLATPEEKARLWPMLTAEFPLWGHFQKHCDRDFKVFILSPAKGEQK